MLRLNLIGQKFGHLEVLRFIEQIPRGSLWEVRCDCGKLSQAVGPELKSGHKTTCGCRMYKKKHGDAKTRFYDIWIAIKYRSSKNKKGKKLIRNYKHVRLCNAWKSYLNFKKDMFDSYNEHVKQFGEKNTSIDRINNKKGYSQDNCRWATFQEQSENRRNSIYVNYQGKKLLLVQWAKILNKPKATLMKRFRSGWSEQEIIEGKKI